ncbi:MAG TPA: dTDP-4-dehydrorhamnose reductase [Patescibacteria group bacterium]|jgi:dTDP-4-dehydrorhamnose reductase|nr:dTDP-4-dehydrorhamnose reductase [Patescibacteria group bacterium]
MIILILGSDGTLGQELAKVYEGDQLYAWDRSDLDITNETQVAEKISQLKPDLVFNCAAYNDVDKAEEERQLAESVNGSAVGFLARSCASVGAILVHFSSNYVFEGARAEGYNEDDLPSPISTYGKSKLMGEIELQKNSEKFYLIRTAWLYGRSNTASGKKSFVEKMLELSDQEESIDAIEDEFGNPTLARDLAQATAALVAEKKPFGIYHLTNAGIASWFDWAKEIFTINDIKAKLAAVPASKFARRAQRPKYGTLNNTKYIELRPWTEALKEYLS